MISLVVTVLLAGEPHIKAALEAYAQGQAAVKATDWTRAEKSFLLAMDIEPAYTDAYRSLIDLYTRTKRPIETGAMLTRLLQIEPASVADRLRLGWLLVEAQQWSRALAQFSVVMNLMPANADGLYGFAYSALKNGMPERAATALKRGMTLFPSDKRFATLAAETKHNSLKADP